MPPPLTNRVYIVLAVQVVAAGHLGPEGCDESASLVLTYSGGRTATLATSSRVNLPNQVSITLLQALFRKQGITNMTCMLAYYVSGFDCRHKGNTEAAPVLDSGGACAQ